MITVVSKAQYNKIFDFTGANGQFPACNLITDGTYLYGMTGGGGANNTWPSCWDVLGGCGTIFKIKPDGTGFVKLFDFDGPTTGANPQGALFSDGTFLYGTTLKGGTSGNGTIFKIKPDGTGFLKLFDFDGTNGGASYGSLISDSTYLYGMTSMGGASNKGAIFKIKPDGTNYSIIHDCDSINGCYPQGDLFFDGTFLYGMMGQGGSNNSGAAFKLKPDGTSYSKLLDFSGTNGKNPFYNSLIFDGTFLFGMTGAGGVNNMGTIFKIKPDGTGYSKLYDFSGVSDGNNPTSTLTFNGSFLYGTTIIGGLNNKGVIFKIEPDGTNYSKLVDLDGTTNGSNAVSGSVVFDSTSFYGMTNSGGLNNDGIVYSYSVGSSTGIVSNDLETRISMYPNPTKDYLTVVFPNKQSRTKINIIDVLGKEIKSINVTGNQLIIETNELKAGIYFMEIIEEGKNFISKKIIIEK
ncbi:MAG: choice-of-anchor tandem repeat GloVer-containing protein [Bacteroidia bacterium]